MEIGKMGKITLSLDISERDLGDEVIVMKAGKDELHTFKDTGLDIWKLLKAGNTAAEILESIIGEYDISKENASEDLADFLESCKDKGLISY